VALATASRPSLCKFGPWPDAAFLGPLLVYEALCSAKIRVLDRTIPCEGHTRAHGLEQDVAGVNRAVTTLLVEAAVGSRFNVDPVLLGVIHSPTAGNLAWRSGFVERAGTRTVAKRLGSVAPARRIPLINNHLDRHLASPNAARALFLVGSCCKSPMTAFPVNRKRRWNTAPGRRHCLFLSLAYPDFHIADFIEFNRLEPRINHWQRIAGYGVPGSELVFGVSALPDAEEKFSGLSSDAAAYR
jgi:hypothetical protein